MILKFPEDTFSTVVLAGPSGALNFILIAESESVVQEGSAGIRVVHAFNGVGDVVLMDGDGNALIDAIGYPAQSDLVRVTEFDGLTIQPASGGAAIWTADPTDFQVVRNYTLVIFPAATDSSSVQVKIIDESTAPDNT